MPKWGYNVWIISVYGKYAQGGGMARYVRTVAIAIHAVHVHAQ